jgi:predicted lipoprotein
MRKEQVKVGRLVLLSLLLVFCLITSACTIRKINEKSGDDSDTYATWQKTGTGFNAEQYVNDNWECTIVPIFAADSFDISEVLQVLRADLHTAVVKFGYRKEEDSEEMFFKVKGRGLVVAFDDSSRNGLLDMDVAPADGIVDIQIQVGPVIKRTEIRDSLSFIKFTDIGNQLQFASLSDELNKKALEWALKDLLLTDIVGKSLEFTGVFRIDNLEINTDKIIITPVIIDKIN